MLLVFRIRRRALALVEVFAWRTATPLGSGERPELRRWVQSKQPSPTTFLASNSHTLHPSAQHRSDSHKNGAATLRTIQRACLGDQHNCHNHLSRGPGGSWIRGPVRRTHLRVQFLQACFLNPESSRPFEEERLHSSKCRGILHFVAMQNAHIRCHWQQVADCRHPDGLREKA